MGIQSSKNTYRRLVVGFAAKDHTEVNRETTKRTLYVSDVQLDCCLPDLPDVLWLQVFSYLLFEERMRISCVCRRWNRLSRDAAFWRCVDFKFWAKLIDDTSVKAVVLISEAIQIVDLSGSHCQLITDQSLSHLAKYCPRLRKLNLEGRVLVTDNAIANLASSCHRIEELILNNCRRIGDKGIKALARCPILSILSVAYCFKISDKSLMKVLKTCHHLEALNITGCTRITDHTIKTMGQCCKSLKNICLKNTTEISLEAIEILVKGATGLRHVELGILQDERRTIAALNVVVYHCPSLEFLSFQHHHSINTGGGTNIVAKKRLREFISRLTIGY